MIEETVGGWLAQVTIEQERSPSGAGNAGGQVAGQGGLSFAFNGAGDHEDAEWLRARGIQKSGPRGINMLEQLLGRIRGDDPATRARAPGIAVIGDGSHQADPKAVHDLGYGLDLTSAVFVPTNSEGAKAKGAYTCNPDHNKEFALVPRASYHGIFQQGDARRRRLQLDAEGLRLCGNLARNIICLADLLAQTFQVQ